MVSAHFSSYFMGFYYHNVLVEPPANVNRWSRKCKLAQCFPQRLIMRKACLKNGSSKAVECNYHRNNAINTRYCVKSHFGTQNSAPPMEQMYTFV